MFSLSSVKESKSAEGGPFPLVDLDREVQISGGGGSKSVRTLACSVRDLHIYWFVTQRAIICSATTMSKLNCDS